MSEPDLRALALAGGLDSRVVILPTAAAPDHNSERAGRNALRWFGSLGASAVEVVPVVDRASASRPDLAERVRSARLVYMLGGFPGYLAATLQSSLVWQAALEAYKQGAVVGGSSAGAMVLCEHLYDPQAGRVVAGLNLIANCCVLPHHNTFGRGWAPRLSQELPDAVLLGIDEQTGILDDAAGAWTVYGAGRVTIYHAGGSRACSRGEAFPLPIPPQP